MGEKEPPTTSCCPFTPSFGDCSVSAEVCEKMLYCTASLLSPSREENGVLALPLSDSVLHFGLHTGKEANLLASKPTTQPYAVVTQTMDINLRIGGGGRWNTIVLGIWNLLLTWSGYLQRLDINLIGGDLLGSSGHPVLTSSRKSEKSQLTQSESGSWNSALAASGHLCLASIFVCHSELVSSSSALF